MCSFWYLPIGCTSVPSNIVHPAGYPLPPTKMICPRCGKIGPGTYRQNTMYCGILFMPCIPCGQEAPFLACSRCNFPCGSGAVEECAKCKVSTCYSVDYCPNCGTGRTGVKRNAKAMSGPEVNRNN